MSSKIVEEVKDAYSKSPHPSRIKALVMTNPHNPIGGCYSPTILQDLMKFCKTKGLHYISVEIFAMSAFGGEEGFTSALSLVHDGEESPMDPRHVHVIYSMSKDFGSAGLRMVRCCFSHSTALLSLQYANFVSYLHVQPASHASIFK